MVAGVWAAVVAAMVACLSHVCQAHFNPALSLATKLLTPDALSWRRLGRITLSQLLGAAIGAAATLIAFSPPLAAFETARGLVRGNFNSQRSASALAPFYPNPNAHTYFMLGIGAGYPGAARAFATEAVGAAALAFVWFSLRHPRNRGMAGDGALGVKALLFGLTMGGLMSVMAPITMAGLNPARDIAARLLCCAAGWGRYAFPTGGPFCSLMVYTVAPLLGALLGGSVAICLGDTQQ
ncbi:aquaporin-like protein [Tribonema minus]|uniref:Aquaporin-like protein n=1 Tax=Tribonema minus TaxID=303371 RepID=A0A835YS68_9STRA|nr:aquaporin-like protein [Tribonema minus]